MGKLADVLLDPGRRRQVVADCATLVDQEVASKGGLSGIAIKGAYAIFKRVKPGIVPEAVDHLLDEFVHQLEPFYDAFKASGGTNLPSYLVGRSAEVASALLGITDARARKVDNRTIKSAYDKLRPSAVKQVEAAVPGIGRVIAKHA